LPSAPRCAAGDPAAATSGHRRSGIASTAEEPSLILYAIVLMILAFPTGALSQPAGSGGFYCVSSSKNKGTYSFALNERPDRTLEFGVSLWWPDGKNVAVIGTAWPSANGWRYEDVTSQDPHEHCVVDIVPVNGGYSLAIDQATCQSKGGFQAVPAKVAFTKEMRQSGPANVLDSPEIFLNTLCKARPVNASLPLQIEWQR
jgi:hypothetical protein